MNHHGLRTSIGATSGPWQFACDQVDANPRSVDACLLIAVCCVFFGARISDALRRGQR